MTTSYRSRPATLLAALALLLAAAAATDMTTAARAGQEAAAPRSGAALPWIRIEVDADGVYALTGAMLQEAGWPLAELRADALRLSSQGDDIAFQLEDLAGGSLTLTTTLRFYGQRFHGDRLAKRYADIDMHWGTFVNQLPDGSLSTWSPKLDATMMEKYTATNVYWLRAEGPGGPRMGVANDAAGPFAQAPVALTAFTDTVRFHEAHAWFSHHFSSTQTLFWARINSADDITQAFTLTLAGAETAASVSRAARDRRVSPAIGSLAAPHVMPDKTSPNASPNESPNSSPDARVRVELVSRSERRDHRSAFEVNGVPLGEVVWHGKSRVHFEASLPRASLVPGANIFSWRYLPGGLPDDLYLDWIELTYARDLDARGQALVMSLPAAAAGLSALVTNLPGAKARVYDISDPRRPLAVESVASAMSPGGGLTATFTVPAVSTDDAPITLWVGSEALAERRPLGISARSDPRPGLIGAEADYLIITPAALVEGSRRLAAYRTRLGHQTAVLDLADLYDAYNFGIVNPMAIRNFLADAFASWRQPPKYLLLVGDGHWDMRGDLGHDPAGVLMPPNLSWVDPWQGEVDSANLLGTVADGDNVADLAIGRLPVSSPAALDGVIDKIIAYEAEPAGYWQRQQLFVADNPDDAGNFVSGSDAVVRHWSAGNFGAQRVYLGDYQASGRCRAGSRSQCQAATDDVVQALDQGVAIVNFTGHASLENWTHEQIFVNDDVGQVANAGRLPIILSWTCLDGYWYHPDRVSLAETWLGTPLGGAVATFSPTGLGVSTGHDILQSGFYQAIYGDHQRILGDITLAAKRALAADGVHPDLLHTFTLFGDPALRLHVDGVQLTPVLLPSLFRP